MTKLSGRCDRSVVRSSVMPSAKYSCSVYFCCPVYHRVQSEIHRQINYLYLDYKCEPAYTTA
jgi:hypothetical protein